LSLCHGVIHGQVWCPYIVLVNNSSIRRYKSDEVLLTAANDSVDFSLYYENSEWTIENSTANLTIENDVSYLNYTTMIDSIYL
jgi:hypothetical protein